MKKFLWVFLGMLVLSAFAFAEHDRSLVKSLDMNPNVYRLWRVAVEKEVQETGENLSRERQIEIYKEISTTVRVIAPPQAKTETKVEAKAETKVEVKQKVEIKEEMPKDAPPPPPDMKGKPFTVGMPKMGATKPNLGTTYKGYWMLMGYDDDNEPQWMFVDDGVRRKFTEKFIDHSDDPYDGPNFKSVKAPSGPAKAGADPTEDVPVAAQAAPVVNPMEVPIAQMPNFPSYAPPTFEAPFYPAPIFGALNLEGLGLGLGDVNNNNGNSRNNKDRKGKGKNGTGINITIDNTNINKNNNKNGNANKNGNNAGNSNKVSNVSKGSKGSKGNNVSKGNKGCKSGNGVSNGKGKHTNVNHRPKNNKSDDKNNHRRVTKNKHNRHRNS